MKIIFRFQKVVTLMLIIFCSIPSFAQEKQSPEDGKTKSVEALIKEIYPDTKVLTIGEYPGKITYSEKTVFLAGAVKVSSSAARKGIKATITYTESLGPEYPPGSGIRPVSAMATRIVLNVPPEEAKQVPETPKRFVDNGDGTITDTKTNLMWQKKDDGKKRSWKEVQDFVHSLKLAGHTDWRLPATKEHDETIVMALMGKKRSETLADWYWSSDQRVWLPFNYPATNFRVGPMISPGEPIETDRAFVRCVRNLK